jgi:biofilm PGA synthesis protein PgaA
MKRLLLALWALTACIPPFASAAAPAERLAIEADDARYRTAIEEARAGRLVPALAELRTLVARYPARQDLLGDYAVVLGWASEPLAALALLDRIDRPRAPLYVIEGLAGSARAAKQWTLAETLYREAIARTPERVEPQLGLARTLADAGQYDAATAIIESLRARDPRRIDVLEAAADIAAARGDDFGALAAWQAILVQEPSQRTALRGKVATLARLGAPPLALALADRHPGLLTSEERAAIAADQTAHQIRWGAINADTGRGPGRFAQLDRALADSDAAGARALDPATTLTTTERQLALDRVGALRERFRMREAVALYEALAARPEPMPGYAQAAVASAYLYLEQPEKARDRYRAALVSDPDNLESRIGLFYALAEAEEHAAARVEVDRAVASTPQWIDAWSPATVRENPAYARALSAQAMAPLFANRPRDAEQQLHALADRAPFNMEIRTDYASSMRARGWPRMAEQELRWVLAADPENSGALGERAGALLEMRDYRNAEEALTLAQAVAAEDGRVVRAARLSEVHNLRELVVEGTYGRSSGGGPLGTEDYAIAARLYSSPINYNYRVFASLFSAAAKFGNGTGRRERAGVGVEYRSPLVAATGEVAYGSNDSVTAGTATLALTPNDYWTFRAGYATSSNATPLQASLAGIDAKSGSLEAVWQASESRSAAVGYQRMDFSDNNRRDIGLARWTERVVAGPVYKLEVTGAVYASQNSLANAPYFNPSQDFAPTVVLANEWLQWRRYTRAFRHRVVATAGTYWQQGFGTGSIYGLRYEQEWTADDQLTLRYGIGRNLHPYDGAQTATNFGYFYLNGRF